MKTLVIGLGNPILSDDSVGLHAVRLVREKLPAGAAEVIELYAGGIRLIDVLAGRDRVILVDAMITGTRRPGEWVSFRLTGGKAAWMPATRNSSSTHDMSLPEALELGSTLGMKMPSEVWIWGVEAYDVETFSEKPTERVARSIEAVAQEVADFAAGGIPVGGIL